MKAFWKWYSKPEQRLLDGIDALEEKVKRDDVTLMQLQAELRRTEEELECGRGALKVERDRNKALTALKTKEVEHEYVLLALKVIGNYIEGKPESPPNICRLNELAAMQERILLRQQGGGRPFSRG